ncbi:MAG: diguanylate cyclase [Oscillospiraceae bacterium]|nr:diguanylate cyclase [Oscillospiraceae bacterium]
MNTDTNVYVEFIPHEQDEALDIHTIGKNFSDIVSAFVDATCPPDLDTVRTAFTKENVLRVLEVDSTFTLTYRMMVDGTPSYVQVKATRLHRENPTHVLFALSNTDAHMRRMAIYERAMRNQLTFAAISEALSSDYDCIFYINTQTNEFIEYSSSDLYKQLNFAPAGDDFFAMCKTEFVRIVYEEDRDIFLHACDKNNLLKVLSGERWSLLSFRVVLNQVPVDVLVKITKMSQADNQHLVLGLSNIGSNLPRIQQYEQIRKIANRDSLTGVRSKHAFTVDEARINQEIELGETQPFAVVVCDVNGLKRINDTLGHRAGDDYLCRSCKMICAIFAHSPVYRVGGDEFVALLTDGDYQNRVSLMRELHSRSAAHIGTADGASVSGGLAEYTPGQDRCIRDLFERADASMYKDKMLLKRLGAVIRDEEPDHAHSDTEDIPAIHIRRHILIADDQDINREILGDLLSEEYDILTASDGVEAMEMLRRYKDEIALLLLDLYMPRMNGKDVLRAMQVDEELMSIPVIMLTIDPDAELDSLRLGAMDFISKPYPDIEIVKARIAKCIELSENRDLIRRTQRDRLTGLFTIGYFLRYVDRLDRQYKGAALDALVCDVSQFRAVNEQYGRQFGDLVLRDIGAHFRKLARKTRGIGCRQGSDTFLLYCPHRDDYEQLIAQFLAALFTDAETADRVRLRFGVYAHAERESDPEKRFSCAKAASDRMPAAAGKLCAFYLPHA